MLKVIFNYFPRYIWGCLVFVLTGRTPARSYRAMRRLYSASNGRFNDALSACRASLNRPYDLADARGVAGSMSGDNLTRVVEDLQRDGIHRFDSSLSVDLCHSLERFARETPALLRHGCEDSAGKPERAIYSRSDPLCTRYDFEETDLLKQAVVQQLITDQSLLAVAQAYLGSRPVFDLSAMWWSCPFSTQPSSAAAQLFHADMDRIRFLKFFFYLTDVGQEHGPHCFVLGSHRRKPRELKEDRRYQDHEVERHFKSDQIVRICGNRGTIFAADTRALHKGIVPLEGERLVFQIEFSTSLFGAPYQRVNLVEGVDVEARAVLERYPGSYSRLTLPSETVLCK